MNVWEVPDEIKTEFDFQLEAIRELKKKYELPEDVFEFYSFKFLRLLKGIMDSDYYLSDMLAARMVVDALEDVFTEFQAIVCEMENYKGDTSEFRKSKD